MRPLETDRLLLRPFIAADHEFVLQVHRAPELARFIPSAVVHDLAGAREMIGRFQRYDEDPLLGIPCVTLRDGTPVALIMLKPIPPSGGGEPTEIEIGWRVHPGHGGHGYVTEAARAVLKHGLAGGLDHVVAVTDPENVRSQAVAQRIGMRRIGLTDAFYDQEAVLFRADAPG